MSKPQTHKSSVPFAEPLWLSRGISPYHNESHRRLQREARAYVDSRILPFCAQWERQGFVPPQVLAEHAQLGYVAGTVYPMGKEYLQGQRLPGDVAPDDWDAFHIMIVFDEIARCGCLGVIWGLVGGITMGNPPLLNYGNKRQKTEFLSPVLSGKKTLCLGVVEPGADFDVAAISTTAERRGDNFVVNGVKERVVNGISADYCTVAVRTGGKGQQGISLLIIALTAPGVTRRKMETSGVRASGLALIEFKNVQVPASHLLGRENYGFQMIMTNYMHQRNILACLSLRLARCCIEDAYMWASRQRTLDRPLVSDQVFRNVLSSSGRIIDAAYAWLEQLIYTAAETTKTGQGVYMNGLFANLLVLATQTLEHVNREAQQMLGGKGHPQDGQAARVEQIGHDIKFLVIEGGGDEALTELALAHEERAMSRL